MKKCSSIFDCLEEKRLLFTKNGYLVKECKACRYRFYDVDNSCGHFTDVYSDNYFFNGKDGYPNYLEESDILVHQGMRYANFISKYVGAPGTVLDVGCAAGFILKGFQNKGWECQGIEPNKTMVNYGKNSLNLNISAGDLETFKVDKKFDLILMIQVIGHFHDIDKAIQNAKKLLQPKGFIIIESWNMNSLAARILGKWWPEYSPPSVVRWFSSKALIEFMCFYKFKLIDKGYPLKLINVNHAISLLDNKIPEFPLKKVVFNEISKHFGRKKLYYPPVDLNWYIFQNN